MDHFCRLDDIPRGKARDLLLNRLATLAGNGIPIVEAKARANQAHLAVTLVHEFAHALLHSDVNGEQERAKREVEAEAVSYVVGRYFGLDTSRSAFYLAAWQDDDAEVLQNRLNRINLTAETIIDIVISYISR